jgi:hypothetical protein
MIDFLVWQGYSKEAVDRMTLRQISLFIERANVRLAKTKGQNVFGLGI